MSKWHYDSDDVVRDESLEFVSKPWDAIAVIDAHNADIKRLTAERDAARERVVEAKYLIEIAAYDWKTMPPDCLGAEAYERATKWLAAEVAGKGEE